MYGVSVLLANVMPAALTLLPFNCIVALPVVPKAFQAESSVEVMTTSFGFPVVPISEMLFLLFDNETPVLAAVLYTPGTKKIRFGLLADDPDGTPPLPIAATTLLYAPA